MVTATVDGQRWYWKYAPISEFLAVPLDTKWWHLWNSERKYLGHFPTKTAMMNYITVVVNIRRGPHAHAIAEEES